LADRPTLHPGLVVASHGRHCLVETPDGKRLICHPRGKKSAAVVGDPGQEGVAAGGDEAQERGLKRRRGKSS